MVQLPVIHWFPTNPLLATYWESALFAFTKRVVAMNRKNTELLTLKNMEATPPGSIFQFEVSLGLYPETHHTSIFPQNRVE